MIEQWVEIEESLKELMSKDLDSELAELIDENFWDLL